jgi:hypothetical protein
LKDNQSLPPPATVLKPAASHFTLQQSDCTGQLVYGNPGGMELFRRLEQLDLVLQNNEAIRRDNEAILANNNVLRYDLSVLQDNYDAPMNDISTLKDDNAVLKDGNDQ